MGNPLEDSFTFTLDKAELWWSSIRDTGGVAERILADNATSRLRVRAVAGLWFSSAFISIIISLPAYSFYGLKLENLSFHLSFVLFQYVVLLVLSWILHQSLKLHKVASDYVETLTLYSVIAAALTPIHVLLMLPSMMHMLSIISATKAEKSNPFGVITRVIASFNEPSNSVLIVIVALIMPPVMAGSIIALAATVRIFCKHYLADEWRVVRAFACALIVLMPIPFIVLASLGLLIYYAFVT